MNLYIIAEYLQNNSNNEQILSSKCLVNISSQVLFSKLFR